MHTCTDLLESSFLYSTFSLLLLWLSASRAESPGSLLKELVCTKGDSADN